ncbi:hypothetical protein U3516DRAFT_744398 [Neocallimastix sp. 'constans']
MSKYSAPMSYHFGVDALSNELQNHRIWRCWIRNRNHPLQACIRTTENHDHSVDDDFFDLGLGCQMNYLWVVWVNRTPDY